jgi:tyrosine-protein kinase Etk/Wzc
MDQKQGQANYEEYRQRLTNFSNEFDLGLFLHIVRRSVIWVVACLFLAGLAAIVYLRYTPEIYKSRVVIQLGEDNHSESILNFGQYADDNTIQSRLELLRSKLLIKNTLQHLPMRVGYFAEGEILTNEHYTLSPYEVELISLNNTKLTGVPIFISFENEHTFNVSYQSKGHVQLPLNQVVNLDDFSIRVTIKNWKVLSENGADYLLYFTINGEAEQAKRFFKNLDVRILNNTAKTLEISFTDNNPLLTYDFVMAHAAEFIRYDLERRSLSDENIINFIDSQIDTVFYKLRDSEGKLNQYKQDNKITNLESISGVYLDRLTAFEDEIIDLELQIALLDDVSELTELTSTDVAIYNLVPLVAGGQFEGSLTSLLDNLHQLLLAKEEALFSITLDNTKIKNLEFQIDIQKTLILETISALKDKLIHRKEGLEQKLGGVEKNYYSLPAKELEFARLQRLFTINEKYYTLLLEKRIEYR